MPKLIWLTFAYQVVALVFNIISLKAHEEATFTEATFTKATVTNFHYFSLPVSITSNSFLAMDNSIATDSLTTSSYVFYVNSVKRGIPRRINSYLFYKRIKKVKLSQKHKEKPDID